MSRSGAPGLAIDESELTEARALNAQLEALIATQPPVYTLPAAVTRQARREGKGIFPAPIFLPDASDIEIKGRGGPIKVRLIRPDTRPAAGIYLHIHGGGWTLGAHDMQDVALKDLANQTQLAVASIDYRLSPEHPYPAGPDDCEDAVLRLLDVAPALLGAPGRFAIGGESAGAHLSVVTLLRLRDRHGMTNRIAAANLVFGPYDLNGTPSQRLWGDRNLVLSWPIITWFTDNFLPDAGFEQRRDPDMSPLFGRLNDMPPALFTVGTVDCLMDDSLFMAERWKAAGNRMELAVYPEGIHAFNAFPTRLARRANQRQHEFLRSTLT